MFTVLGTSGLDVRRSRSFDLLQRNLNGAIHQIRELAPGVVGGWREFLRAFGFWENGCVTLIQTLGPQLYGATLEVCFDSGNHLIPPVPNLTAGDWSFSLVPHPHAVKFYQGSWA